MTPQFDHRTDTEQIRAAQEGDKAAFGQLVERYGDWVRRAILRRVHQPEIAQELTQESFLQAYLSLASLRQPERFGGWLQGILRNVCYSYLRRQKGEFRSFIAVSGGAYREGAEEERDWEEGEAWISDDLDPYQWVETWERRRLIEQAIEGLSVKNKVATRLFYYEQLSLQEIAQHLGVSVNVVKARLHQARKQLQLPLQSLVGSPVGTAVLPPAILSPVTVSQTGSQAGEQASLQRRNQMNKIDTIRVLTLAETSSRLLCLFDRTASRVLQIWVGSYEGELIANAVDQVVPFRPTTYHLIVALLKTTSIQLTEVRIEKLQNNTFYATLKVNQGKEAYELDARPSDAIELALLLNRPIYVADEVISEVGRDLPQPFDETAWLQAEATRLSAYYQQADVWQKRLTGQPEFLTLSAREVIAHVHQEAKRLNHNYLGTEHLLLGMVYNPLAPMAKLLASMGATQAAVRDAVDRLVGSGQTSSPTEPMVAPRLAQVFTFAVEAMEQAKYPQLSVEHLLIGMLREGEGMAVTILQTVGVDLTELQKRINA